MKQSWHFHENSSQADLLALYQAFLGHELLNELVAAQGLARMLGETATEFSESNQLLLKRLADRLRETDQQTRQLAELGRFLRTPAYGPVWSVEAVIQETLLQMSALSARPDIKYSSSVTVKNLRVSEHWFRRLTLELLRNAQQAIAAAGSAGQVLVQLGEESGRCVLGVRDNGIGFSQKEGAILWQPFQPGRRFRSLGGGFGFFLIRQILQRWRGSLQIESVPGDTRVAVAFAPTEEL